MNDSRKSAPAQYSAPVLVHYGNISNTTAAGSGRSAEAMTADGGCINQNTMKFCSP